jgi:hypothetical protein
MPSISPKSRSYKLTIHILAGVVEH